MVAQVEVLRYKPEGYGFNFLWHYWNFPLTILLTTPWTWGRHSL